MNQLDLSYYSKKDLPNILVYIELVLTVFLLSFRMKDYMTNYRNFDIISFLTFHTFLSISVHRSNGKPSHIFQSYKEHSGYPPRYNAAN